LLVELLLATGKGANSVKFIKTFSIKPVAGATDEIFARFKQTGARPPKGATLLGRWIAADFSSGFELIESDDVTALAEFVATWSDVMEMKIVPVVEETEFTEVLKRLGK
jgi:hypothetical protein